ncbi:hypothetical protein CRG98_005286 [Punica granatum]|uniref:Retrotransposon gag domain-containing protein n=1 Tax=Punica granatum TaxID=22663 RepID=A0A2I0L146_PUNGR|nr:hypothetical protein CRG98_005286 [Punica granatum]
MRCSRSAVCLPFDPEIERTLHRLFREACARQNEIADSAADNNNQRNQLAQVNAGDQDERPMDEFIAPRVLANKSSIQPPAIQANNFEIKPSVMQMIQNSVMSGGAPTEDPHKHMHWFVNICYTFKHNGISDDAIRLRLFLFSLKDKASLWPMSLPAGSITTWTQMEEQFLAQYFPPSKIAKMRNDCLDVPIMVFRGGWRCLPSTIGCWDLLELTSTQLLTDRS